MSGHTATPDDRGWENGARTTIIFHATFAHGDWWQIFNPANEMTLLARETDEARAIVDTLNSHAELVKALEEIRDHWANQYDHPRKDNDMYRGSYGIGVTDGHRACAIIARAALATLTARKAV